MNVLRSSESEASDKVSSIIERAVSLPPEERAEVVSALLGTNYQPDVSGCNPEEIETLTDAIASRIERG